MVKKVTKPKKKKLKEVVMEVQVKETSVNWENTLGICFILCIQSACFYGAGIAIKSSKLGMANTLMIAGFIITWLISIMLMMDNRDDAVETIWETKTVRVKQ